MGVGGRGLFYLILFRDIDFFYLVILLVFRVLEVFVGFFDLVYRGEMGKNMENVLKVFMG